MICKQPTPTAKQPEPMPGESVGKRVRNFYSELTNRAGVLTSRQQIEVALQREYSVIVNSAAQIPLLKSYNKLENLMARALGWKSWVWQAANRSMTNAGEVRYLLQDRARVNSNFLQHVAMNKAIPDIKRLYGELKEALPQLAEADLQQLLHDQIVVGQFPTLKNVMQNPIVHDQLHARFTAHQSKLSQLGLVPAQVQRIDELAGRISGSFDTLRHIVGEHGVDIETLKNGGYFPIQLQDEANKLLGKLTETARVGAGGKEVISTGEFLKRSRASSVPIATNLDQLAKDLGMPSHELLEVLTTPGALTDLLKQKLNADQIEQLFESGHLAQAPAMSDELTNFFSDGLDLPLKNLGQAIVLDPVKAIENYTAELKSAVENSTMVKTLLTEGQDAGWVIPAEFLGTDGRNTKDYIRLGSSELLQKTFKSQILREDLGDLFVHRTVAEQLNALVKMNSDFGAQVAFGRTLQNFFTGFRRSAILATGGAPYMARVSLQNAVSTYAATGGLTYLPLANAEVFRMFSTRSLEALNDTKVVAKVGGKEYTLRSLFENTLLKRGTDTVAGAAEEMNKIHSLTDKLHPDSLQRFWMFNEEYHRRFGSPITGKIQGYAEMAKEVTSRTFNAAYGHLAAYNQLSDFSARWAAVRDLAINGGSTGKKFKDLEDLLKYTDEYFNIQEDVGSVGANYGRFGVPFAGFAMAAPGQALRQIMLEPWRTARMGALYAHASQGQDLTDAEMAQWQKDSYLLSVFRDPVTKKQYAITPGSVDFYRDSYTTFTNMLESVGRAMGAPVGSIKEQVEQKRDPLKPASDFLQGIFKDTYFGQIALPFMNKDPQTMDEYRDPEKESTLLGVGLPVKLRDALVGAFPLLKSADAHLPAAIVGQKAEIDASDLHQISPGTPGWAGIIPDDSGAKRNFLGNRLPSDESQVLPWFFERLGLTLSEIDTKRNLINNYNDFDSTISKLGSGILETRKKLTFNNSGLTEERKAQLKGQVVAMERMQFFLKWQKWQIDQLAAKKGIPTPTATKLFKAQEGAALKGAKNQDAMEFLKEQGLIPNDNRDDNIEAD